MVSHDQSFTQSTQVSAPAPPVQRPRLAALFTGRRPRLSSGRSASPSRAAAEHGSAPQADCGGSAGGDEAAAGNSQYGSPLAPASTLSSMASSFGVSGTAISGSSPRGSSATQLVMGRAGSGASSLTGVSSSAGQAIQRAASGVPHPCVAGTAVVLDDPAAAYFLVATEAHVRLYSAGGAARADRTVTRRVDVPGRLKAAACFAAGSAAGMAALVACGLEERLLVRTAS